VPLKTLTQVLETQIHECEVESRAYAEQSSRGSDVFDNARAASFFAGKIEALTSVLMLLETQPSDLSVSHFDSDFFDADCSDADCSDADYVHTG